MFLVSNQWMNDIVGAEGGAVGGAGAAGAVGGAGAGGGAGAAGATGAAGAASAVQQPNVRVLAHERLGQVVRILRNILERYRALQATELLVAAASLVKQVEGKQLGHGYPNCHCVKVPFLLAH